MLARSSRGRISGNRVDRLHDRRRFVDRERLFRRLLLKFSISRFGRPLSSEGELTEYKKQLDAIRDDLKLVTKYTNVKSPIIQMGNQSANSNFEAGEIERCN